MVLKTLLLIGQRKKTKQAAVPAPVLRHLVFRNCRKAVCKLFLLKGLVGFLAIVSKNDKNYQKFQENHKNM